MTVHGDTPGLGPIKAGPNPGLGPGRFGKRAAVRGHIDDGRDAQGIYQLQPRHTRAPGARTSFADRLRADGIDAEIDQYNAVPPEGWPLWCERQITAANVVLMICTETYYRRVSGDEEQGKGLGVVWEARIIRQLLYDAGPISDKFVPVLFSDASPGQIPIPIKGWTFYVVDTEDGYEDLYRRLTGQPRLLRPALGPIRPLPTRRRQWPEGTMQAASNHNAFSYFCYISRSKIDHIFDGISRGLADECAEGRDAESCFDGHPGR